MSNAHINRLFVYGTLAPERAPEHLRDVVMRFRFVANAHLCGQLFTLGAYPGMTCPPETVACVYGRVYIIAADDASQLDTDLARLDAYEGFKPSNPDASLFRRVLRDVIVDEVATPAWIYLYNRQVSDMRRIASGRWCERT